MNTYITIGETPKCHCGKPGAGTLRVGGSMLAWYCQAHYDNAVKAGLRR